MSKSIISEGKTTNEAIENGLKELKVSKNQVDIKILENEEKRSFFSILAPRIVKVELTLKEKIKKDNENTNNDKLNKSEVNTKRKITLTEDEQEKATKNIEIFLNNLKDQLPENATYEVKSDESFINVKLKGEELGFLIGYRGETLYAMQNIMSAIAGKNIENKVRVSLDIEGYKEKRVKTLENLAMKVSKTVIRTGKDIKLEPMQAYERKIIHSALQENSKVETVSVGEEPNRRIIISLKK